MPIPMAMAMERLTELIRRDGPVPFDRFMAAALYDPDHGFFMRGGGAGRAGRDFVTSPEVGPLFGALVARALDDAWDSLGCPDPFLVVEAGAGRGQLARDVMRVGPRCAAALRYVMVEHSPLLREQQHEYLAIEPAEEVLGPVVSSDPEFSPEPVELMGPMVTALGEFPAASFDGVVIANELLDNLPLRIVERGPSSWMEVRVGLADQGDSLVEVLVPAEPSLASLADALGEVPVGTRVPLQTGVAEWLGDCAAVLRHGLLIVIDYAVEVHQLAERGQAGWLRTYQTHQRGGSPLEVPGMQDITCDVVVEGLERAARRAGFVLERRTSQAAWLHELGIDELVEQSREAWGTRAHLGDLEALKARSAINEAAALCDPTGLGAHQVWTFHRT